MSTTDMITLILKYLHDKHPGIYDNMTADELSKQPYHKLIWTWWTAKAYYRMDNHYLKLEDAPDGLKSVWIMGEKNVNYIWVNGKYEYLQEWDKEECKSVYGDRIPGG